MATCCDMSVCAVADLTAKLERIMKSDYFTIQPIQQVPVRCCQLPHPLTSSEMSQHMLLNMC